MKKKETNSGNQDTSELKNEIDKALTTSKSKRKRNPKSSNSELESIDVMEYRALGSSLKTVSVAEVVENMDHPDCKLDDLCWISTQMYSGLTSAQLKVREATLRSLDMLMTLKKCDLTSNSDQDTETKDVRASKCVRAEIMRVA